MSTPTYSPGSRRRDDDGERDRQRHPAARPAMRSWTARLCTSTVSLRSTSPPRATTCAATWKASRPRLKTTMDSVSVRTGVCPRHPPAWTASICRSLSCSYSGRDLRPDRGRRRAHLCSRGRRHRARASSTLPALSFDSLAQMNPELLSARPGDSCGHRVITTGASSAELHQGQGRADRDTRTVAIPFDTQNTESDQYDFGKVVTLQEGADGSEDDHLRDNDDRRRGHGPSGCGLQCAAGARHPEITVTGTKLKNGMIAKVGSGSFIWPVPNYKYVSRWMGNGHRGADICAAYGTPILASDSGTDHCCRLALFLRKLCGDRPRQRLQDAVRSHVQHRCFCQGQAVTQDGPGHRLCRLHGQLHRQPLPF